MIWRFLLPFLTKEGYRISQAQNVSEGLSFLKKERSDLILCDLIIFGIEFLEKLRKMKENIPTIMISSSGTHEKVIRALKLGASDFITKPLCWEEVENVLKKFLNQRQKSEAHTFSNIENFWKESFLKFLKALAFALEAKNFYAQGHSERVTRFAIGIGKRLKLSNEEMKVLELAGILHDIGKIAISDEILNKRGRLTSEEWKLIQKHPLVGSDIMSHLAFLSAEQPVVRHHHEHYDGKGYPDGLKGDRIPLSARILAIADAYDAMISPRAYRSALPSNLVRKEIEEGSGFQFDPEITKVFIQMEQEMLPV